MSATKNRLRRLEAAAPKADRPVRVVFERTGPEQALKEVADLEAQGFQVLHVRWAGPPVATSPEQSS